MKGTENKRAKGTVGKTGWRRVLRDEEAFFASVSDSKFWKPAYFMNIFSNILKHVEGRPLEK